MSFNQVGAAHTVKGGVEARLQQLPDTWWEAELSGTAFADEDADGKPIVEMVAISGSGESPNKAVLALLGDAQSQFRDLTKTARRRAR